MYEARMKRGRVKEDGIKMEEGEIQMKMDDMKGDGNKDGKR